MLGCKRLKWSTTFWVFVWYPVLVLTNKITSSANYYEGKSMILYFLPLLCLFAFDVVVVFRFQATNVDIRGAYQQREKFIE